MDNNFDDIDSQEEPKSKTQLKAEMNELQKMGEKLVQLSQGELNKLSLDEELRIAIDLAQRINNTKEGKRRQLQFIGKLMRTRDVEELRISIAKLEARHHAANSKFHALEQWRDKLLSIGDTAINDLMEEHPHLDRQKLRTLVRLAKKQQEQNKPPKSARELFQYLKAELPTED